jgi:hypothetical protein
MMGDVTPPPGARGAGRCGIRLPFAGRGTGGGALGFSKLSGVLLGKRGLNGVNPGLKGPWDRDSWLMGWYKVGAVEKVEPPW